MTQTVIDLIISLAAGHFLFFTLSPLLRRKEEKQALPCSDSTQGQLVGLHKHFVVLFVDTVGFLGFYVSLPICMTWQPKAKPSLGAKSKVNVEEWKMLLSF